jgi:hypothetical protein
MEHDYEVSFTPRLHQWHALQATLIYDVTWMCGGLGAGKTHFLVQWAYDMASDLCAGVDGLIVEPDFDTFYDTFMPLWRAAVPGEGTLWRLQSTNQGSSKQLAVRNTKGGWTLIYIRSAMNAQTVARIDGLTTVGWWGLDEPARMKCGKAAFQKALGRGRAPTPLGRNPGLIVGSPRGFNWVCDAFKIDTDHPPHGYTVGYSPRPGYFVRACRTRDNEQALGAGYEQRVTDAYGEAFAAQELSGGLVRAEGQVFETWYPALHVVPHAVALKFWARTRRRAAGVDWGYTKPASVMPCGLTGDGEFIVIDEWYHPRRQAHEQGAAAARFREQYGVFNFHCDPEDSGKIALWQQGFAYQGRKYTLAAQKADNAWEAGNDRLRQLMAPRRGVPHPCVVDLDGRPVDGASLLIVSDRCTNLIKEFGSYLQRPVQEGQPIREGATGEDHAIDGVRYVANALVDTPALEGAQVDF